jgi:FkbM family methyltransferase
MKAYLKHGRWGEFLLIAGDLISDHFNLYGQWAETEIDLCRVLLTPDSVVIEAGANLGTHTVALSKLCPAGQIIVFEPQSKLFGLLSGNLAINRCDNVRAFNMALADTVTEFEIETGNYDYAFNYGAFSINKGFSTERQFPGYVRYEKVRTQTIDAAVAEQQLERVDLLKIDVEGYEQKVLDGAKDTIARFMPDLIVEAVDRDQTKAVHAMMKERGYSAHWIAAPRFVPTNYNCSQIETPGYDFSLLFRSRGKAIPVGLQAFDRVQDIENGVVIVTHFELPTSVESKAA